MFDPTYSYSFLNLLSLPRCNLTSLPTGFLKDLPALEQIDMRWNSIRVMERRSFQNLTSLLKLYLDNNKLWRLFPDAFLNVGSCSNPFSIKVTFNEIRYLQSHLLKIECLTKLFLGSNLISEIASDAFASLPNLSYLDLFNNSIRYLKQGTLPPNGFFFMIKISNNFLKSISGEIFRNKTIVTEIHIQGNEIATIEQSFFTQVTILGSLFIEGNRLTSLPRTLSHQTHLQNLHIFDNHLQGIRWSTFKGLSSLIDLNLMYNKISQVEDNSFASLENIRKIYLQGNPLTNVSQKALLLSSKTNDVDMFLNCTGLSVIPTTEPSAHLHCVEKTIITMALTQGSSEALTRRGGYACEKSHKSISKDSVCRQCHIGTKSVTPSKKNIYSSYCASCPPGGYYQDEAGQRDCKKCVNGTFVDLASAPGKAAQDCKVCPRGTDLSTHAEYRACNCLKNHYRTQRFGPCYACDSRLGMTCRDDYLSVAQGFWWSWKRWNDADNDSVADENRYVSFVKNLMNKSEDYSKTSTTFSGSVIPYIHRCPINESCRSETSMRVRSSEMCSVGYWGTLCGQCRDGYYSWFQRCHRCPQKWRTGLQFLGLLFLLGALAGVLHVIGKLKRKKDDDLVNQISSILKITVGFIQVMSVVFDALTYVPWPEALLSLEHFAKMIELNVLAVATPACLHEKLRFNALMLPIIKFSIQVILLLLIWGYYKATRNHFLFSYRGGHAVMKRKISEVRTSCMTNSWWILFICYPSTATSILATVPYKEWTCTKICLRQSNYGTDSDKYCRWLLKVDYSVPCNYSTSTALWVTCTVLILYVVVLPLLLLIALKLKRREGLTARKLKPLSLRGDFLTSIQFLDSNYKDHFWYWEMVEIGRKMVLTVGMGFFGEQSHSGIALATLLATVFLVLHAQLQPVRRRFEHWMQLVALSVISTNLMMGALVLLSFRDKRDPGYNSLVDRKTFSGIVIAANTFYLLFVAAIVFTLVVETRKQIAAKIFCYRGRKTLHEET
ncbi:uncharacterized protein [Oscarella lobularis]|uniref:uncharacterized protein isoform X2 n=1 Tax=Oscarella lobularis TaxID=121494 RepID=UPI0033136262